MTAAPPRMPMSIEQRAREFCEGAFRPFGVASIEPYVKIIAEFLDDTVKEAARPMPSEEEVARAMCQAEWGEIVLWEDVGDDENETYRCMARAVLALFGRGQPAPEWQWAPKKVSIEMAVRATMQQYVGADGLPAHMTAAMAEVCYLAMLAAVPAQPAPPEQEPPR